MKPSIFVGSSAESLAMAHAVQRNLDHFANVKVWNQGIFTPSQNTIDSLITALDEHDFAIFIFSPQDLLNIRGEEHSAVRDNVILELGLFAGRLGKERTYIISPRNYPALHIPSDLIGVNTLTYDPNSINEDPQATLGSSCSYIQEAIQRIFRNRNHNKQVKAIYGVYQEDSKFNRVSLLRNTQKKIIITGPNLRSWLGKKDTLKEMISFIKNNERREMILILATPEVLEQFGRDGVKDLEESVRDIKFIQSKLNEEENKRFTPYFNIGPSTLSVTFCDPDEDYGFLVFNPRFAIDHESEKRLYCVLRKFEHGQQFHMIYSSLSNMTQRQHLLLEEMCGTFKLTFPYRDCSK